VERQRPEPIEAKRRVVPQTLRLDRLLANLGYGSRTEVQKLIRSGRVTRDEVVMRDPAVSVSASGLLLDGEPLDHPDGVLVMLHKPAGYVCTHNDGEGPTVFSLLPPQWLLRNPRVEAVGRLDKDTTGLLLLTDDHELLHRLTSPRHHVEKVYEVVVDRDLSPALVDIFAAGTLMLRGDPDPCLEITGARTARVTVTEGRYHQVKRMFGAAEAGRVIGLNRVQFGDWSLAGLVDGAWRPARPIPKLLT
jgi:16S rRNA pseudouridine516 synthase